MSKNKKDVILVFMDIREHANGIAEKLSNESAKRTPKNKKGEYFLSVEETSDIIYDYLHKILYK
jgi:hypothetical protein